MDDIKNPSKDKETSKDAPSLVRDDSGLSLQWKGMVLRGDFTEMIPRLRPGRLEGELIVKASGIMKSGSWEKCAEIPNTEDAASGCSSEPLAIDATAGLGEDSLLLAAAGFRVKLYENDEVIFSLLKDAVERALALPDDPEYAVLKSAVSRMAIYNADSIEAMKQLAHALDSSAPAKLPTDPIATTSALHPDVVFLDPMFPERKKSSLVGKKLQILQQLESPCDNERELLDAAMALAPKRILIKRPPKGPYLCGIKPTFSLSGKSVRIDCIVL